MRVVTVLPLLVAVKLNILNFQVPMVFIAVLRVPSKLVMIFNVSVIPINPTPDLQKGRGGGIERGMDLHHGS